MRFPPAREGDPVLELLPRDSVPDEPPGSLTSHADHEAFQWQRDHRLAVEYANTPRGQLEAHIECLIALLDALDGDADMEAEPDDEDSFDREQNKAAHRW